MSARNTLLPVALFAANPGAPGVTPTGGVAGHYTYKLVGKTPEGHTAAGAATAIITGPTTLDVSHYNTIDQAAAASPGAASFDVYRTAGGLTQGKIGNIPNDGVTTLVDNGLVGDTTTPPVANTTGVADSKSVVGLRDLTVEMSGTFVGTVHIEGSLTGKAFSTIGSDLSPGLALVSALAGALGLVRLVMTAYTSGTPVVYVAGN